MGAVGKKPPPRIQFPGFFFRLSFGFVIIFFRSEILQCLTPPTFFNKNYLSSQICLPQQLKICQPLPTVSKENWKRTINSKKPQQLRNKFFRVPTMSRLKRPIRDSFKVSKDLPPDKLKPTKTREPQSGADVMKTEIAIGSTLKEVEKFDKTNMKNVDVQEKNPLPDKEAIRLEAEHNAFKDGVEGLNKDKLNATETVEKNTLPTKEVIEQEKKAE